MAGRVGTQIATAGGLLTLNSTGSFTYIPNSGYVGSDAMTVYFVSDGVNQSTTTADLQFVVTAAPLTASGVNVPANTNIPTGSVSVATFTDTAYPSGVSGGANASNYTASINWGDGTSPTGGAITASGNGFLATGTSHTYTTTGTFTVTTTIDDNVGATTTATSTATVTLLTPPTPAAPSASLSGSSIALTWSADLNAASYALLRSDNGGTFAALSSGITGTSFTDSTVVATDSYAYELTATDAAGTSSAGTASGSLAPIPVAPSSLTVTAATSSSLIFGWTPPAGATGYIVDREAPGETAYSQIGTSSTASYTDTSLLPNEPYSYVVFATDTAGTSLASGALSATTLPGIPSGLAATGGDTQITLNWSAPTGGANSYNVYRYNGSAYVQVNSAPITATTYADTGLTDGTAYSYEVSAVNTGGEGTLSSPFAGTPEPAIPATPTGLAVTPGDGQDLLAWTASSGATSYKIYQSADGVSFSVVGTSSSATFTDAGLTDGTTYYYEVSAVNGGGESAVSASVSATPEPAIPAAPTGLTATVEDTQTLLSWTAGTGATSYNIYQYSGSVYVNVTSTAAVTFTGATSAIITGLTNGTSYSYEISAVSSGGQSALSAAASVTPAVATVEFLTATPASTTEIDLSWDLNTIGASAIEVDRSANGTTWTMVTNSLPGTATSYADTGLSENSQYYYRVCAIYPTSPTTYSAYSVPASASTLRAVTGLTATAASASEIDLAWTLNITDATGIEIDRSTNGGVTYSLLMTVAATAATYADTSLSESSAYFYQVNAITAGGGSEEVTSANATTLAAVDSLTATAASMSEVDLSWNLNVADATALEIDRSTDAGVTWTALTTALSPTATTYADTGLADNTDYTYQVRAIRPGGDSAYTAPADATTTAALSALTATTVSTGEIDLAWTPNVTDPGIISVLRYTYPTDGSGGTPTYSFLTDSALDPAAFTTTGFRDTSVTEGNVYSYRVQAAGYNPSNSADASTTAIQNLNYTSGTTGQTLIWTVLPTDATSIEIDRSADGTNYAAAVTGLSGSATSYADSGLSENTEYWYEVKINEPGGSETTAPLNTDTLPMAPTAVTVIGATSSTVDLGWTNPGLSTTPFFIERSEDGGTDFETVGETAPGATSYVDSTVEDGASFVYQINAVSLDGSNSNPSAATVTASTPLIAPTNLMLDASTPGEIDLTWKNASQLTDGYTIQRSPDNISWSTVASVSYAGNPAYNDSSVTPGIQYYYRVIGTDANGDSSASSNVAVAAAVAVPPPPSLSVWAADVNQGPNVTLNDLVTHTGQPDPVTGFNVNWGDGSAPQYYPGDPGSIAYTYASSGTYTITATSADGFLSATSTAHVAIPYVGGILTYTEDSGDYFGQPQGSTYGVTAAFTDPNGVHVNKWLVDWNDGTVQTIVIPSPSAATDTYDFTHIFGEANLIPYGFNVTIAAETSDGVYQIAPTAAIDATSPDTTSGGVWGAFGWEQNPFWDESPNNGATAGNTGASMPVQFAPLPSGTAAITYTVDFGDSPTDTPDTAQVTVDSSGPSAMFYHQFPDFGYYIVKTTGSDGSSSTISLYVPPTAAVVNPIADQTVGSIDEGQPVSFSTGVSGLWPAANALAYVDWGDGTGQHPAQLSTNSDGTGTITATLDHNLAPGDYAPTVTLYLPGSAQHDGFGQGSATSSVAVSFSMHVWGASLAINGTSATSEAESAGGAAPDGVMPVDTSLAADGTTPEVDLSDPDSSDTAMVPGSINYTAPADSGATWQMSFPSTLRVFTDFNGTLAQIVSGAANAIFGPQGTIPLEFQGCAPGTDQQATVTVTPGSGTSLCGGDPSVTVGNDVDSTKVRVDSNRDGAINFGDTGPTSDLNTRATPYQFWLNSDEIYGVPGSARGDIVNEQELENFARVQVQVPAGFAFGPDWFVRVSLPSADPNGYFPKIKLFDVSTAGMLYVTDTASAQQLLHEEDLGGPIGSNEVWITPAQSDLSGTTLSFLFEGIQGGEGALTFSFYHLQPNSGNTAHLAGRDQTYINLVTLNNMYEHWTVGDTPGSTPTATAVRSTDGADYGTGTPPSGADAIVFVHGWRMKLPEKVDFANIAFRRLYWQGFSGRFYSYSWPTDYVGDWKAQKALDPANFNRSEDIAWEATTGLQKLLTQLDALYGGYQHVNIFAHSMGNVVVSEALRLQVPTDGSAPQKLINAYVATQAAIASEAYDTKQIFDKRLNANFELPIYTRFDGWFADISSVANRLINFYNPLDNALYWWKKNKELRLSDSIVTYSNGKWYFRSPADSRDGAPGRILDISNITDLYLIFAYYVETDSLALGAQPDVGGPFDTAHQVNLHDLTAIAAETGNSGAVPANGVNFADGEPDHSAEFYGTYMQRKYYWNLMMKAFGVAPWDPGQTTYPVLNH